MATGMLKTDPGLLGRDFKTFGFNSNWTGYEGDDISAGIARTIMSSPELLAKLGLSASDISYTGSSASAENDTYGTFKLSDAARKALSGLTVSRTGVAGMKDGRSQVIRDAQGNILSTGDSYSYDPAGDLKDAAIKGLGVVGAGWAAGNMLGLAGGSAAPATAAGGATAGAEAGAVASGAEAAGAAGAGAGAGTAGAVAGDSAVKAALFGEAGYGAGMSGAATSAFDTVLGLTGSTGLASGAASAAGAAASGGDWLSKTIGAITGGGETGGSLLGGLFSGSSALRDILGLVGAGVQQYNLEKMAKDNREWASAEKAKERRRQMPVTGAGLLGKFRVIPSGAGNGG